MNLMLTSWLSIFIDIIICHNMNISINMTQLLDNTYKSTTFANIRTPTEDEKSSENYDYCGFLLKSIELQLRYSLLL